MTDSVEQMDGPDVETEPLRVDAICCFCKDVTVCSVSDGDSEPGDTFHARCANCSEDTPHNIVHILHGLNRTDGAVS